MQNAADFFLINVRNALVWYMKDFVSIFHKVLEIDTKYATNSYWHQIFTCCADLVPILHSVNLRSLKFEV